MSNVLQASLALLLIYQKPPLVVHIFLSDEICRYTNYYPILKFYSRGSCLMPMLIAQLGRRVLGVTNC